MWEWVGIDGPTQCRVYSVYSKQVGTWIEEQAASMWKHYEIPPSMVEEVSLRCFLAPTYLFTEEMEVLFLLRWS